MTKLFSKKRLALLVTPVLVVGILAGCAQTPAPVNTPVPTTAPKATDTTSSASVVDNNAAFEKAISASGTWIIATTKDLTFTNDLTVDGTFNNEKTPPVQQRKIGLYTQDANRNVTARFTLTAPKLTFNSPAGSIEHGTFKGDLYVSASNFQLKDATVEGNVYFTTDAAKSSFKMDATSKVTGVQELKK